MLINIDRKIPPLIKGLIEKISSILSRKNRDTLDTPEIPREGQSDREHWETRYSNGGTSGPGSIDENRDWKWGVISQYIDIAQMDVLDIGCGDLSFWEGRTCRSYTGLDFSETVIHTNRVMRPDWKFIVGNASHPFQISGSVVFCLDMLFHVMDDSEYESVLRNLAGWCAKWLFIYTWWQSPFGNKATDNRYQIYRPLLRSSGLLSPLEFVAEHRHTGIGALYVFKKK